MKQIIILVVIVSLFSCEKNKVDITDVCDISYFDKNGKDLLDPNNPESFKETDIDIYYLIDGIKVKQYQENLEYPESFSISDEIRENKHYMRLFLNHQKLDANNRAITYIKFGNSIEDKIEGEFKTYKNSSSIQVVKIWYNDELMWQNTTSSIWFEIIK